MPRKGRRYHPKKVHGNFGPGGFSDQYDNTKMRSMDRDLKIGGVTYLPFEDDVDLNIMRYTPEKGERYPFLHPDFSDPDHDEDLGRGRSGTNWNLPVKEKADFFGKGPKNWKLSDEKLKIKVSEVLLHSSEVDPSQMTVQVKDKVVTLKGLIRSEGMKTVAEDLVLSIPAVEDVDNQLRVP